MNARLYLIEGLPGSGKTTTAEALTHLLQEQQTDTRLHIEGDLNHPADSRRFPQIMRVPLT